MSNIEPEHLDRSPVTGSEANASGAETAGLPVSEAAKQFLKMLETNYGIRYLRPNTYEINRGDVIYEGPLDFVLEVYSGVSKPGGSE